MQYRSVVRDTTSEESASPLMNSNAHPKSRSSKTQQSRRQTLMFQTRTSSESTGKKVVPRTKPPRQDVRTTIIKIAPPTIISAERKLKVLRALQMADRKQRMKDEFSTFCTDTSFTAIVRIYNATSSRIRLFWSVLFLIMFVWMTVQVTCASCSFSSLIQADGGDNYIDDEGAREDNCKQCQLF